jgi:hypothetical protein
MNQKASLAVRPEEGALTARSVAARMQWPLADLVQSFQRQVRPLAERQVVAESGLYHQVGSRQMHLTVMSIGRL